jgi:hypothetical protein
MKKNYTIEVTKYSKRYNIICVKRDGLFEYYLEKNGYGHWFFIYAVDEEVFPSKSFIKASIQRTNEDIFWEA